MIKVIPIDANLKKTSPKLFPVPNLAAFIKGRAVVFTAAGSSLGQFLAPSPPDTGGWTWYRAESVPALWGW